MKGKYTKLQNIAIEKFRGLENINIDFADRITLICGKNGTSKSTILGIVAQIFSFRKQYFENGTAIDLKEYNTLMQRKNFESLFSDHFRFSEKFDVPGSMKVKINLFDGLENKQKNDLQLGLNYSKDRSKSRPILRGNNDRNITHPLLYLSVDRLTPIVNRNYVENEETYLENEDNKSLALKIANQILLKENTDITSTGGTINSLAPHNNKYDFQSISVGEDNVGQIVRALLSFRKLKEEYENYSGGILLIDEVDAGLFPAAQIELFKILRKLSKELNLQVIMTSHSPILIEEILNEKDTKNYKINYLTDTYGPINILTNPTWAEIEADIHVKVIKAKDEIELPKINVYCEDIEARDFFKSLIIKRNLKKLLNISNASLGGEQLMTLADENLEEFTKRSIIVLDADKDPQNKKNFVKLPGDYPPDQLLFSYLINKKESDPFWNNRSGFTRPVFIRIARRYLSKIDLPDKATCIPFDLSEYLNTFKDSQKNSHGLVRDSFKSFYKSDEITRLLKAPVSQHPFRHWIVENEDAKDTFEDNFIKALKYVLINGHRVPKNLVNDFFKDL